MRNLFIAILLLPGVVPATALSQDTPDPKTAFLKSMVLPGWGHHYVDPSDWKRGQYHLAAEGAMVLSFLGLKIHSNNLLQNWHVYAQSEAGVPVEGRSRNFQLAVGDFNSLEAYNNYQAQSRNWDRIFDDNPENRWDWSSTSARLRYNDLRHRFEKIEQQLPALVGLMIVNRVISGISAYNRARKMASVGRGEAMLRFTPVYGTGGIVANVRVQF